MNDKLIRQLVIAALVIVVALGVFSLISTLLQLAIPLAVLGIGGFAFYKIVLEGRDVPEVMEDEVAESSAMVVEGTAEAVTSTVASEDVVTPEETQQQAEERLSAVEKAQRDYVDNVSPAEEILDQINARKQRLQGDDDA